MLRLKGTMQAIPLVGRLFQDITPAEVRAFWDYMMRQYEATTVNKSDSLSMKAVGTLLDTIGVLDKQTFLKQFTTTLGTHIYTPFEIGVPMAGYDLWWQVMTCVHECQHIHQFQQGCMAGMEFAWEYVTSPAQRARYEAQAYTCDLELEWWRRKAFSLTTAQYAQYLASYGCSAADITVVKKQLDMALVTVKAGGVMNAATKTALAWLNQNVPRLRAP